MAMKGYDLSGKVALVSHVGTLEGHAIALALAEAGAKLALASSKGTSARRVMDEVRGLGVQVVAGAASSTDENEVEAFVRQALERFGRIDVLVNSADVVLGKPLVETTVYEWQRVQEVNLLSAFLFCRAVGRGMLQQRYGRIVNLSSGLSVRGMANATAYCASKGGILQFTRALAMEWAPYSIRVNALAPGWLEGSAWEKAGDLSAVARFNPSRRLAKAEELGPLAVYLASEECESMTGQTLFIEGGVLARAP